MKQELKCSATKMQKKERCITLLICTLFTTNRVIPEK